MKDLNIRLVIIILIFGGAIFGLVSFGLKPRWGTLKNNYRTLFEAKNRLAALSAKKETLLSLKKNQVGLEDALKKAQNLLPASKQTSEFLVQLEAGALETGNKVKNLTLTETPQQKQTSSQEETLKKETMENQKTTKSKTNSPKGTETARKSVLFSIEIEGNFTQLKDFLALTEALARLNLINTINITTSANNLIKTKIEGEVYYQ